MEKKEETAYRKKQTAETEASITDFYRTMGISEPVCAFGESVLASLEERFKGIDETAEYNQMKVLKAMQDNRVSEACHCLRSITVLPFHIYG